MSDRTVENALLEQLRSAERVAGLPIDGLTSDEVLDRAMDAAEEAAHSDPVTAGSLIELVRAQATAGGRTATAARADYLQARMCAERGDLDAALDLIGTAREGWIEAGEPLRALRTEVGLMQVLDDLGRHGEALTVGERLLVELDSLMASETFSEDLEQAQLAKTIRAGAWANIGAAAGFTGQHDRSVRAYEISEAAWAAVGSESGVAEQQANRGIELMALGRLAEARDVFVSASAVFTELGDPMFAAKCEIFLGEARGQLGELVSALRGLEKARVTLTQLDAGAERSRVQLEIAKVYLVAGLFSDAAGAAQEAGREMGLAGLRHDAAFAALTASLGFLGAHDLDNAESQLTVAEMLFDEVGDRQYRAQARLAAAEIAARRGRVADARVLLSTAVREMVAGGWQVPLAWARLRQFDLCPDPSQANAYLDAVTEAVAELGLPTLRYAYTLRAARAAQVRGHSADSQRLLREAIEAVRNVGFGLPDAMLRTAFRADKFAAHDELVNQLIDGTATQVIEAAHLADQAKASTLSELIDGTLGRSTLHADVSERDDMDLVTLQSELSAVYGALQTTSPSARRDVIRDRVQSLERQIATWRLNAALSSAPAPADNCPQPTAGTTRELPQQPVLAFHVVHDDVIVFAINAGEVRVRRLSGVVPDVDRALDRLTGQWSRMRMGGQFAARRADALRRSADEVLKSLYQLLIAPVRDLIDGWDVDEFVVVPHRQLHRVPFHALHDGTSYLLHHWAISLSPILPSPPCAGGDEQAGSDKTGLLVVAAPDASAPLISKEAEELKCAMPGAYVASGVDATREVLTSLLPGPKYLHLACHGLYRAGNPLFSAIRLSDGWVTSADVLELDLGGALVTLSACESGRAATDTAEPVGLAWAFLAAGASGVVVSQWIVDDTATTDLMVSMYRHLAAGRTPMQALRKAQIASARSYPHPFYWAPFVHVASPNHIK